MELDWSTFVLEIINVLVLVWLLKRFLYKPVMTVMEERKIAIAKTVADAQRVHQEAETLQQRYEQRLIEWDKEKEKARAQLQEEMGVERQEKLAHLRVEMETLREQHAARESRQMREVVREAETTAILHGTQFAAALLGKIASPELEGKLIDVVLDDLAKLSSAQIGAITSSLSMNVRARVTSAFPMEASRRELLSNRLEGVCARRLDWEFLEDRTLLAGVRVSLGGWVLRGNLQDELKCFAESEINGR